MVRRSASVAVESTVDCRYAPSHASTLQPSVRNGPDIAHAATSAQYWPRSPGVRSLIRLFPGTLVGIAPAELPLPPPQPTDAAAIPSAIAVITRMRSPPPLASHANQIRINNVRSQIQMSAPR